jgi:hypothetical protein
MSALMDGAKSLTLGAATPTESGRMFKRWKILGLPRACAAAHDFCVTVEIPKAPAILYSSPCAGECFGVGIEGRIPQLLGLKFGKALRKAAHLVGLYPFLVGPTTR